LQDNPAAKGYDGESIKPRFTPHHTMMTSRVTTFRVPTPLRPILQWHLGRAVIGLVCLTAGLAVADETDDKALKRDFAKIVRPFVQTHCLDCHGPDVQEAKLDLSVFSSLDKVATGHATWELVLERLRAKEMPPPDAEQQPDSETRRVIVDWIGEFRKHEALRNAGDPGPVLARRLSNAEYNYTIRDLTGVDMRPTQSFPVDPANAAGFDNSGESLAMSPALLKKYLDASRDILEHLVLKPQGFAFAPHPVVTHTDRDKYCVNRIIQFYQRQPTDVADYFLAAWRFQHRQAFGNPEAALADVASEQQVSPRYLATVWSALVEHEETVGPIAKLQAMWQELPVDVEQLEVATKGCHQMRDYVVQLRQKLEPSFYNLNVKGSHKGSQPFVLWKNRQYATHRMSYDPQALRVRREGATVDPADADLLVPADPTERQRYETAFAKFCRIFPNAFYVSERGRDYLNTPKAEQEKGRLLSAGFHSMMGYFRDDRPLYELVLTATEQRKLDELWQELDFIASAPTRQYQGFLWFERTDSRFIRDPIFDFARAEDNAATSAVMIKKLAKFYLAKAKDNGGSDVAIKAIEDFYRDINAQIRWVARARLKAEPSHLEALLVFAAKAYRRTLSLDERDDLLAFYHSLRAQDKLGHEAALQDSIVSVLMSPHFCYRLDLLASETERRPLSDQELASRLSYFLWSSMPDARLLARAATGELHHSDTLVAETKRMLRDPRAKGLATEFAGNWLDIRRFEEHNSVDRQRFPNFTDELRRAMFDEPAHFFLDLVQNDRSVLDCLDADHTFVNAVLAKHYGIEGESLESGDWRRIDQASRYRRGGLLPMSVFLTKNAPGLRTSPVKRGYWVVRRLLGERIPPPPPNVPELPADESKLGDLSLREMLAKHRDHKSCAGCHDRFDAIGLVFENYGPVGELRDLDLGGRPVDTHATLANGRELKGLHDLRAYLREERQEEFLENLCRKLLSYALGRTLLLSDDLLVQEMRLKLADDGYRFGSLVETIVASSQFLEKRGNDRLVKE
jgi:hypothetical protein